jgi:hemerythrin-like domain-containing protein
VLVALLARSDWSRVVIPELDAANHWLIAKERTMKATKPSLAEAMTQAHAALMADLRQLQEATQAPAGKTAVPLADRLCALRAHLAEHFRFEEQNGYLDSVRKRQPQQERVIAELLEEHRQLAQSLDALIETFTGRPSVDEAFREQVGSWIERIRHHEARENRLVQETFNMDIGAED